MMKRQLAALLLLTCALCAGAIGPAHAQEAQPAATFRLYLPLVPGVPGSPTVFGVEATRVDPTRGLDALAALQPSWVRRNGLRWSEVEPVEGHGYRWDSAATRALESDMIRAAQLGLNLILVVHSSPGWALPPNTGNCGPILPAKQAAFARFLAAATARYSKPPYSVKYWELGNEPDAPPGGGWMPYGCWGVPADPYFGGRAYGAMLKVAYPAIKGADPQAQVLNGGLLLDRPYDPATGAGRSARFLEGALEAGAGGSFDMLSFHSYSHYDGDPDGTTGATDWKPAYLRGILQRYGLSKPLINTEGALLCHDATFACSMAQAHAMPRLYARALRDGLSGLIWYVFDSDGFRNTALVDPGAPSSLRPAHAAFAQASAAIGAQRYAGPIAGLPAGVEGYRFTSGRQTTLLLWANATTATGLSVGAAVGLRCAEWDGAALPCAAPGGLLQLEARRAPRYITYQAP